MCKREMMYLCGHTTIQPETDQDIPCFSGIEDCDKIISQCGLFYACISCENAGVDHTIEEWYEIIQERNAEREKLSAADQTIGDYIKEVEREEEDYREYRDAENRAIWEEVDRLIASKGRREERDRKRAEDPNFYESDSENGWSPSPPPEFLDWPRIERRRRRQAKFKFEPRKTFRKIFKKVSETIKDMAKDDATIQAEVYSDWLHGRKEFTKHPFGKHGEIVPPMG